MSLNCLYSLRALWLRLTLIWIADQCVCVCVCCCYFYPGRPDCGQMVRQVHWTKVQQATVWQMIDPLLSKKETKRIQGALEPNNFSFIKSSYFSDRTRRNTWMWSTATWMSTPQCTVPVQSICLATSKTTASWVAGTFSSSWGKPRWVLPKSVWLKPKCSVLCFADGYEGHKADRTVSNNKHFFHFLFVLQLNLLSGRL